jgi:Bacterial regulatory protein, arsR family.
MEAVDRPRTVLYYTKRLNTEMTISARQLNLTFAALSDPTRRAILSRLASGEATVMDLAKPFDMTCRRYRSI